MVIYLSSLDNPVIPTCGVTVVQSGVLFEPVEHIGAILMNEAASNTVKQAGYGTTTATVVAASLLTHVYNSLDKATIRELKQGLQSGVDKVLEYLESIKIDVSNDMLSHVASISCNNDIELGNIIAEAYTAVGKDGVVLMESSDTEETIVETIDGVQFDCALTSPHFITNTDKQKAELENPLVLICMSEITNIRNIQSIL